MKTAIARPFALFVFVLGLTFAASHAAAQSVITGTDPVPRSATVTTPAPAPATPSTSVVDIVMSWLGLS